MMAKRFGLMTIVLLGIAVVIPFVGVTLDRALHSDISGRVQAGIALVSFPIILYQLEQIRQTVNQKPRLAVGLANIKDLPFSQIQTDDKLPTTIDVARGYAHFYLIVQNRGHVAAKGLKIYLEHMKREPSDSFPPPLVKVNEFSEGKYSFYPEHNFDFVFRGGADWQVYPHDFEPFGFHLTTAVGTKDTYVDKNGNIQHVMQSPPPCKIFLRCAVWAESTEKPL